MGVGVHFAFATLVSPFVILFITLYCDLVYKMSENIRARALIFGRLTGAKE